MKTKEDIINLPNPSLRIRSKRVGIVTNEIKQLVKDMEDVTLDWEDSRPHEFGIALAAIQVDKALRVVVVRNDFDNKDDRSFMAFVNPEIVKKEGKIVEDYEGCLSVKDIYGLVPRHQKVKIKALDLEGKEFRVTAEDFLARVFQHEIDHTKGIVFIDHIQDNPDAFYHLASSGKLEKIDYERVKESNLFRH